MFSRTLLNLIDNAIFPAVLVVAAKLLGIVFFSKYFDSSYNVEGVRLVFSNAQDYIAINSYSSLLMFCAVIGGLFWVLVKANVFHDTHITPTLSSRLTESGLNELIHSTETIFAQSFIWLSFAWLVTLVLGVQAYFGLSLWWIFWVALGVSVVSTAILVVDLEKEIEKDKSLNISSSKSVGSLVKLVTERK